MSGETHHRKPAAGSQTIAIHLEIPTELREIVLDELKGLLSKGLQLEIRPEMKQYFLDFIMLEVFDV